jgi:peptidyl-prolyl cis-trans isomerase SurA
MRRILQSVMVLFFASLAYAQNEQLIDSVVAVVNSAPIFQSDWEVAVRYEALMNGRPPESYSLQEQQSVFHRLEDQILIRQQMRGFELTPLTEDDVQSRLRQLRSQLPGASSDEGWNRDLEQSGLLESEVVERLRDQIEIERFLEYRMRPMVRVDQRSVQKYYREQYLPELKKNGAEEVPLAQVSDKIREILTQQRMEQQTALWLQTLREAADIRISKPSPDSSAEITQSK